MNQHKEQVFSPYSTKQLFDLVMDIEKYPEFLPWCSNAKILNKDKDGKVEAELVINFKAFNYSYISEITTKANQQIIVKQKKGPFKSLVNIWEFSNQDKGTQIDFAIEVSLKNPIIDRILKLLFDFAYKQMVRAFTKRAEELFS